MTTELGTVNGIVGCAIDTTEQWNLHGDVVLLVGQIGLEIETPQGMSLNDFLTATAPSLYPVYVKVGDGKHAWDELPYYLNQSVPMATTLISGLIKKATQSQVEVGTEDNTAVTPNLLQYATVATAADLADGHALSGKTTVEDIRDALDVLTASEIAALLTSTEIGKFCTVYPKTSGFSQSLPSGVYTTLQRPATIQIVGEDWSAPDDGSLALTIPEDGVYEVNGYIALKAGSVSYAYSRITINNVGIEDSLVYALLGTAHSYIAMHIIRQLAQGDVVRLHVNPAVATTTAVGSMSSKISVLRVR